MRFWYRLLFPFSFLLFSLSLSQVPPKREFRGAWIATVSNIDWPTTVGTNSRTAQESELAKILDSLRSVGVNAVMMQIRPSCDAFYKSAIEPWSEWLTGAQGAAPVDTSYDPLRIAIDGCRSRGIEFHAWFNPYRAMTNSTPENIAKLAPNHVVLTKPNIIRDYSTGSVPIKVLDPGEPETITYVTSVIMDVVRRYDIDAVHFDDYFYPYPVSGLTFPDSDTYTKYGGSLPLSDWRRENVNKLIKMVSDSIKAVKPRVKFGISPFGIWQSIPGISPNTTKSYSDIYADSRKWLQEAWIDYLAPQLYWDFNHNLAPYAPLAQWWNDNAFSRHMYIGQGVHRVFTGSPLWPVIEIINQVSFNRQRPNIQGVIQFSAKYFQQSQYAGKKLNDSLRSLVYTVRSLVPRMAWKDTVVPLAPDSLSIRRFTNSALITWKAPPAAGDGEKPLQYLLYRSTSLPIDFNDMRSVIYFGPDLTWPEQPLPPPGITYFYAVTGLDRNQNESSPSSYALVTSVPTEHVSVPSQFALHQNFPNPFNPATIISFTLPREAKVSLKVFDLLGREIDVLADGFMSAGDHQLQFNAGSLPTGVYFYRLVAGEFIETKKMQLIR